MRAWFVILMVALLPLRSWADAAMGMQMAASSATSIATKNIALSAEAASDRATFDDESASGPMHDCPGHAEQAQPALDESQPHSQSQCSTCQMCHAVAPIMPALLTVPALAPPYAHDLQQVDFSSAELALNKKPPIS